MKIFRYMSSDKIFEILLITLSSQHCSISFFSHFSAGIIMLPVSQIGPAVQFADSSCN